MSLILSVSDWFSKEESVPRKSIPILLLIIYSFGGAGIFYAIEEGGVGVRTYWQSLWFVNTVTTTIGYGNIYPTTVGGKVFTCGYALFGIPLTLSAFNNIGELMCRPFNFLWNLFHRRRKGKTADSGETEFRRESLPVSLGLLITLCWIIISATYFFFMSANSDTTWYPTSNWYFGDAIYFVFISITTIGFGDFFPTNYTMTAAHFAFIIVGLSLFSMVVNLLQQQLDEFVRYVKKRLFEMYKEALMADRNFTETNVKVLIKKMKGGRFLFPFLSKHIKEELQDELDLYVGRRTKSTQTEKLMIDQCFQTMGSLRPSVFQLTQTVKTFSPAANWM